MKRILLTLITLTISIMAIGCQNNTDDGIITIWHDKEDAVIEVLENAISLQCPDIEVNFVRKESMTETLKLVGNSASTAPDMYFFAHDKIGLFSEIGILEPITNLISETELENYVDLTIEAATYKEVIYQLPLYYETLLFMYNKDRMSEDEVPETAEELYQYMVDNTDSRRYGFVEQYSNAYYSAGWIHGFGGQILDSEGTPSLNTQEVIDALEYHQKFVDYMPQGQAEYATVNTLFIEKEANSIIAGPWLVPSAREAGIDLGFARMPIIEETGLSISPYAGVQGIHVLKVACEDEENKAKITEILNVFLDPEVGVDIALASGAAPANNLSYEFEEILSDELVMAMKEAAEDAIPMSNLPEMDIMWTTANSMLTSIYLNGADIATTVSEAQEESENLIELMD